MNLIPNNKPFLTGEEISHIRDAVSTNKISGDGKYTKLCQNYIEQRYSFKKCLLTTSCTDALEMAAILCQIELGDEVIMSSYTFVSTANAFVLRGAKIIFCDSRLDHPGMDEDLIEDLITVKTKVIVPVHYAGVACDMDKIMSLADRYNLLVVEDAAQAIDSFYTGADGVKKALGSIGHFGCFSFHETKNIQCGEGGMLSINDKKYVERAEIIWEKGTNRAAFWRGEVDKYGWLDIGSSFLPSDIIAAFLWAQLEALDDIQSKRREIWGNYYEGLQSVIGKVNLPKLPNYAENNGHLFYIVCNQAGQRTALIKDLRRREINAVFHYQSLYSSPYYKDKHDGRSLPNSELYSDCLLRLPLYYDFSVEDQLRVITEVKEFLNN